MIKYIYKYNIIKYLNTISRGMRDMVSVSAKGETSYLDAIDYSWNHDSTDFIWAIKNRNLSIGDRIVRKISDCAIFIFTLILGIRTEHALAAKMKSKEVDHEYKKFKQDACTTTDPSNESIILVLNAKADLAVSPDSFKKLERESGYKVVFREIEVMGQISQVVDRLKQSSNKIQALWIRGHGTPFTIAFNENGPGTSYGLEGRDYLNITPTRIANPNPDFDFYTQIDLPKHLTQTAPLLNSINQLEADAPVILEACSTGQEVAEGEKNVAQFIAEQAEGRTVFAPSRETLTIDKTTFSKEHGFEVKMEGFKNARNAAKGSFLARLTAIWNAYKNRREDISVRFKVSESA